MLDDERALLLALMDVCERHRVQVTGGIVAGTGRQVDVVRICGEEATGTIVKDRSVEEFRLERDG